MIIKARMAEIAKDTDVIPSTIAMEAARAHTIPQFLNNPVKKHCLCANRATQTGGIKHDDKSEDGGNSEGH